MKGRGWNGTGRPSSRAWSRVRSYVLARDGYVCRIAGPSCSVVADTVDHVVPLALGGAALDPANLRAACAACNSRSGGALGSVAGRLGRPSRSW